MLVALVLSVSYSSCKGETKKESNETMSAVEKPLIEPDVYPTNLGDLKVTLVGHGSVMFEYNGKIIHVDPYSAVADYSKLPDADLIILTHEHGDHLDANAIKEIQKESTKFIMSPTCNSILGYGDVISNGESTSFEGISIDAVPAYNIVNKRPDGIFYHPKGVGNGYVFTFGDKKVYVAGDTENIPEMDSLKGKVDVAFFPKNLPYTMTDEMFVDAVRKVSAKYVYPYHFSEFNETKISELVGQDSTYIIVKPMTNK